MAPGHPGSAPPLLAQHDWVHVLADYGTQVESELEVFAFIARANDDPRGLLAAGHGGQPVRDGLPGDGRRPVRVVPRASCRAHGMAVRVADAMRRGALSHGLDGRPDVDLMAVDWFALADRPVDELRDAFAIAPRTPGRWPRARWARGSRAGSASTRTAPAGRPPPASSGATRPTAPRSGRRVERPAVAGRGRTRGYREPTGAIA